MPEPKRPIKEDMAEVTKKTIETFPEEHILVTNIAGLYIEVMVLIERLKKISSHSKMAILTIGIRNFRLLYCAGDAIYNGFYEACMILLRTVWESNLLMKYLVDNEEEAFKWLMGKRYKFSRMKVKTEADEKIYGALSSYFTHANVESLFSSGFASLKNKKLYAEFFPRFNKDMSKTCLFTHIMTAWMSLLHLQYAFRDSLWENEEWKNRFADWAEIVLHYVSKKQRTDP